MYILHFLSFRNILKVTRPLFNYSCKNLTDLSMQPPAPVFVQIRGPKYHTNFIGYLGRHCPSLRTLRWANPTTSNLSWEDGPDAVNELSSAISENHNLTELFVTDERTLGVTFANDISELSKLRKLFIRSPKSSGSGGGNLFSCGKMQNLVEMDLDWGDFGERGK